MNNQSSNTFSIPCLKDCPVASHPTIEVEATLYYRWWNLARATKNEWFAFLTGDNLHITDMVIPRQTAGGAHCEPLEGEIPSGMIGAIHSHNTMNAFFSSTDWANMNAPIEIVINDKGDYDCNALVRLDCGRWGRSKASIKLVGLGCNDLSTLESQLVKPAPTVYSKPSNSNHSTPFDWHDVEDDEVNLDGKVYRIWDPKLHQSMEVVESMSPNRLFEETRRDTRGIRPRIGKRERKRISELALTVP